MKDHKTLAGEQRWPTSGLAAIHLAEDWEVWHCWFHSWWAHMCQASRSPAGESSGQLHHHTWRGQSAVMATTGCASQKLEGFQHRLPFWVVIAQCFSLGSRPSTYSQSSLFCEQQFFNLIKNAFDYWFIQTSTLPPRFGGCASMPARRCWLRRSRFGSCLRIWSCQRMAANESSELILGVSQKWLKSSPYKSWYLQDQSFPWYLLMRSMWIFWGWHVNRTHVRSGSLVYCQLVWGLISGVPHLWLVVDVDSKLLGLLSKKDTIEASNSMDCFVHKSTVNCAKPWSECNIFHWLFLWADSILVSNSRVLLGESHAFGSYPNCVGWWPYYGVWDC